MFFQNLTFEKAAAKIETFYKLKIFLLKFFLLKIKTDNNEDSWNG